MDEPQHFAATPATKPPDADRREQPSWPMGFGVFSMVYSGLGMLLAALGIVFSFFTENLMKLAEMDVAMPTVLRAAAVISGGLSILLGVVLFAAGIGLARRRPWGVSAAKFWVVARILLAVAALASTPITAKANADFQQQVQDEQERIAAQRGRPAPPNLGGDEAGRVRMTYIMAAVGTALICVYPFVLGGWLSRRPIREQIESWSA